ncbi:MAG: hypothetical protein HQ523_07830 [Lentisphaerae bacterium]|nr:hypothetical protein [Lentisphaerota bacterium]
MADPSQEQVDDLCRSVAWQTYCDENIKVCAETPMRGNVGALVVRSLKAHLYRVSKRELI